MFMPVFKFMVGFWLISFGIGGFVTAVCRTLRDELLVPLIGLIRAAMTHARAPAAPLRPAFAAAAAA